ncbi:MAG: 50S ribosomal protein L10 [Candidatus Nanoarchaeia archaeon]|nr:50S ribosomal protein L10 [Candidatus Nanoarchaeia archaeon]MDD5054556.1 50S ribosomal protein L10 [Candidatus Nanoarchaeia archaeon]MDD5499434.1 50S ribosomal protein L10 [Candidatus Nanoarchaeia archaeon]
MKKDEAQIKPWKKDKVSEISELLKKYQTIGLIDATSLPSKQLQIIRGNIRKQALIQKIKKSFLTRALEQTNNADLSKKIQGSPIIIFSNLNPFKLNKLIEKNKSESPIKPGQTAPFDLIIPAGETPFTPGPVIGEFGQLGVKAKIVAGKINVLKDSIVVKEGEKASPLAASMLMRLGIKPVSIGLNLIAAKEENTIYSKQDLSIDIESMISAAYAQAKNLAINAGILIKEFISEFLAKAQQNALIINGIVHPEQAIAQPQKSTHQEPDKKDEPEEEEVSDEQAASGLADLFG